MSFHSLVTWFTKSDGKEAGGITWVGTEGILAETHFIDNSSLPQCWLVGNKHGELSFITNQWGFTQT